MESTRTGGHGGCCQPAWGFRGPVDLGRRGPGVRQLPRFTRGRGVPLAGSRGTESPFHLRGGARGGDFFTFPDVSRVPAAVDGGRGRGVPLAGSRGTGSPFHLRGGARGGDLFRGAGGYCVAGSRGADRGRARDSLRVRSSLRPVTHDRATVDRRRDRVRIAGPLAPSEAGACRLPVSREAAQTGSRWAWAGGGCGGPRSVAERVATATPAPASGCALDATRTNGNAVPQRAGGVGGATPLPRGRACVWPRGAALRKAWRCDGGKGGGATRCRTECSVTRTGARTGGRAWSDA
jgi:hypothetical protein